MLGLVDLVKRNAQLGKKHITYLKLATDSGHQLLRLLENILRFLVFNTPRVRAGLCSSSFRSAVLVRLQIPMLIEPQMMEHRPHQNLPEALGFLSVDQAVDLKIEGDLAV